MSYFEVVLSQHGHHVRATLRGSLASAERCATTEFENGRADRAVIWDGAKTFPVETLTKENA